MVRDETGFSSRARTAFMATNLVKPFRPAFSLSKCVAPPKPGFYKAVPMAEYQLWDGASSTRLSILGAGNESQLKHFVEQGDLDTAAKSRGSLLHAAMLEPDDFKDSYAIGPDVNLSTKIGKEEWEKFKADSVGKELIRGKDGEKIIGMRRSIWRHPLASALLHAAGDRELSFTWIDHLTRVVCKGRLDKKVIDRRGNRVVDLKKTRKVHPDKFARSVIDYGYHMQAAHYLNGSAELSDSVEFYDIIGVEETPPYEVCVFKMTDEFLEEGRRQLLLQLGRYKRACEANLWPGFGYDWELKQCRAVKLVMPKWMARNGDDDDDFEGTNNNG